MRPAGAPVTAAAAGMELAASGRLEVDDLLGDEHPLECFQPVFTVAGVGGPTRQFFAPGR